MVTYSYSQLEALWIDAGGPAAVAPLAAALAIAESGGNPLAAYPGTTVAPGQGSTTDATGLWQILGLPAGNFTAAELTIPIENARMAVAKYRQAGNSFSPWQTYTQGTYKVLSGIPPASSVPGADSQGGVGGPSTSTTASTTSSASGSGGGTVTGVQGNVPGVSAPGATPSGAVTPGTATGTGPDTSGPGGIIAFAESLPVIGSLIKNLEPLLHAVATVIDYSFAIFEPGQAQRVLFALAALVLAFFSYRVLASSGALPKVGVL